MPHDGSMGLEDSLTTAAKRESLQQVNLVLVQQVLHFFSEVQTTRYSMSKWQLDWGETQYSCVLIHLLFHIIVAPLTHFVVRILCNSDAKVIYTYAILIITAIKNSSLCPSFSVLSDFRQISKQVVLILLHSQIDFYWCFQKVSVWFWALPLMATQFPVWTMIYREGCGQFQQYQDSKVYNHSKVLYKWVNEA